MRVTGDVCFRNITLKTKDYDIINQYLYGEFLTEFKLYICSSINLSISMQGIINIRFYFFSISSKPLRHQQVITKMTRYLFLQHYIILIILSQKTNEPDRINRIAVNRQAPHDFQAVVSLPMLVSLHPDTFSSVS